MRGAHDDDTRKRSRTAQAAGFDYRSMHQEQRKQRCEELDLRCMCGEAMPSREHLQWECPSTARPRTGPAAHEGERRLAVACAPTPNWHDDRLADVIHSGISTIAAAMLPRRVADDYEWLVATDGGAEGTGLHKLASWGLALRVPTADGKACTFQSQDASNLLTMEAEGGVPGIDQTPNAGEVWALIMGLHLATLLPGKFVILIDNLNALHGLQRCLHHGLHRCQYGFEAWALIARLVQRIGHGRVQCFHVPSHGKRKQWRPPAPHSAIECRELNGRADAAATSALERRRGRARPEVDALVAARARSMCLLQSQHEVCEQLRQWVQDQIEWWSHY